MLHVDIPTLPELKTLAAARGDICVSIFLPTTPLTQETERDRILLKNLSDRVTSELAAKGFDKRRIGALEEQLADLVDDDGFWRFQARSLVVLATPESVRSYRLANRLSEAAEVADRFHLKPLLRAVAFPQEAFVLVLSQKGVRVVEVCADLPPAEVKLPELPKDAASAVRRASVRDRSPSGRIQGSEGQKVLLKQYARRVDDALRGFLAGRETPLLLAAVEPMDAIFRSVNSYPHLVGTGLPGVSERSSEQDLARASRQVLDQLYAREIDEFRATFEHRAGEGRATTDISDAARAATFGAIATLIVDMDEVVPGTIDESDGRVTFSESAGADSYGVVDEIACRALLTGARVLSGRRSDIPRDASLAAILRHPV